ncbi:MAG: hypothetical protein L3J44_00055 [Campylobacteraceae bacterium]|nr:hypothetical protein [Campylobacteraceae bacterium]
MSDFQIPHLPPVRFVKSLLYSDKTTASVKIAFEEIPTLAMLIESAAQSSSGIKNSDNVAKMGFLISLKNVKLLKEIYSLQYIVNIKLMHKVDSFKSLSFVILQENDTVATGSFSIVIGHLD